MLRNLLGQHFYTTECIMCVVLYVQRCSLDCKLQYYLATVRTRRMETKLFFLEKKQRLSLVEIAADSRRLMYAQL